MNQTLFLHDNVIVAEDNSTFPLEDYYGNLYYGSTYRLEIFKSFSFRLKAVFVERFSISFLFFRYLDGVKIFDDKYLKKLTDFSNKYINTNTTYGDMYIKRNTTYSDMNTKRNTTYSDKYEKKNTTFINKYEDNE